LRPSLQIIMLTVYVDNERIFKSLQAGASGYLIKQTAPAELLAAVADVQRGGAPMTNTIARRVVQYFQQRKPSKESENLTSREQEILDLIAQGFRDKEIADKLSVSVRTVGTHIRNIYEKLHVHSRTEAVLKFLNK
ncbi:MAG: LuxR C-terminal-related transcriptional regulator, partial [Limisphaerales bacterium]